MGRAGEGERSPTKLSYEAARSSFVMREERVAPLYLPYISPIPPLYLPYISHISPLYLPFVMREERVGADDLNPNIHPNPNPISNPNPNPTPGP